MSQLFETLPELYRSLFPEFFSEIAPEEKKATCGSCAMCESSRSSSVEAVDSINGKPRYFHPDTKCCTYHPTTPNYLVGAILSDNSPEMAEGRHRIREKIRGRIGVIPLGLRAPAKYSLLYQNTSGFFGKSPFMRCPYYEGEKGLCTIWKYRDAVCSTFFCKYDAGADGRKFWSTMKSYLSLGEIQLSRHVALELHPEYMLSEKYQQATTPTSIRLEDLEDQPVDEDTYFETWGLWMDREEEYYRACYEKVRSLSHTDFDQLLGFDGKLWLAHLQKSHEDATTPRLPRRLKLNPAATVKWLDEANVAVGAYSEHDALALPRKAFDLLTQLNGKDPLEDVRESWRRKRATDLSDEMLTTLYQHRVLVSGEYPESISTPDSISISTLCKD